MAMGHLHSLVIGPLTTIIVARTNGISPDEINHLP
jgi:hypothetical protein